MLNRCLPGHSLTEYSIMLALIGLMCFGALSFLGNSTSSLFEKVGDGDGNGMNAYMNAVLGGNNVAVSNKNTGYSNRTSGNVLPKGNSEFVLSDNLSVDTNTTGSNGSTQVGLANVRTSTKFAKQLEDLADAATDDSVKKLLKQMAYDAYWVAGSQAAYEFHANNNTELSALSRAIAAGDKPDPAVAKGALDSATYNSNALTQNLNKLLVSTAATPEQKAFVKNIVNKVVAHNRPYVEADQIKKQQADSIPLREMRYNDVNGAFNNDPSKEGGVIASQVQKAALATLYTGKADKTPAVKTSIKSGRDTETYAEKI